jgi:NAD(P)-dependent dehydrogenase (short-subunit alcohol dehydrogenase family)
MSAPGGRVGGKVALVTGAGTGIGRAVCVALAQEGAEVVVTSRDPAHVAETCAEVERATGRAPQEAVLDMTDREQIEAVVAEVAERHGRIDILSNNAGIDLPHAPSVEETSDEDWERVFHINVTGVFQTCRAALPFMRMHGSIVNMASMNSLISAPDNAAYSATKGALLQFTRGLAIDCARRGVRANAVCPGIIDTPLTDAFLALAEDPAALRAEYAAVSPLNRLGTAAEVANCVLFLASDESSFVTGSALVVDGATTII